MKIEIDKQREEEKEIERALAGGKMYQIREVKKLLDQALASQLKEVLKIVESKKGDEDAYPIWNDTLDDIKAEVEKLV